MLYRYDGTGKIEEVVPKYYPSPLGVIKVYTITGQIAIEVPDCFGALKQRMATEIVPAILKLMGMPVETPKKEDRSKAYERSYPKRP